MSGGGASSSSSSGNDACVGDAAAGFGFVTRLHATEPGISLSKA